jgi:hypothetical protein
MKNMGLDRNVDLTATIARVSWWTFSAHIVQNSGLNGQYKSFFWFFDFAGIPCKPVTYTESLEIYTL